MSDPSPDSTDMALTPASNGSDPPKALQSTIPKDFGFLPVPTWLRYNPDKPFYFGTLMNISFGFASAFLAANLYYCQPILVNLAQSFDVSYDEISKIPTLLQAGYATGLLLISPLGDLVRRRQLILLLVIASTSLTIGLAVTHNLKVFEALSFLVGVVTVVPQILLPLAADLAPPERRASAISIVISGLLLGVLIARVLGGVIANFISWRVIYYMSLGIQGVVLAGAYLMIPDYPSKNQGLTYFATLGSMAKYAVTEPQVIQASLINLASSACFSNFWVTMTFLLEGPPYHYSTLLVGLFGLVGIFGVLVGPFVGRLIDRLVPWYAALIATVLLLLFQAIQTGAGGVNIAAVVIACLGLDVFRQMQQVSLTAGVFTLSVDARARLNAILILSLFIGQVMGTSVGTQVFVQYGWRAAAGMSMAWYGFQLFIQLLRGPHVKRYTWFGYEGGLEARKSIVTAREKAEAEEEAATDIQEKSVAWQDSPMLSPDARVEKDPTNHV